MRKSFLILLIFIFNLLSTPIVYGDNIPTQGKWDNRKYRTIIPTSPVLFIEGNVLSIHFRDRLMGLTVHVIDCTGRVVFEDVISGNENDLFEIDMKEERAGFYQVSLTYGLGLLTGDFQIDEALNR